VQRSNMLCVSVSRFLIHADYSFIFGQHLFRQRLHFACLLVQKRDDESMTRENGRHGKEDSRTRSQAG
jgi:hypothetical protein